MAAGDRFQSVVVFGAGAVGSFLGARLSRALRTTLVARGEHLEAMRSSGLILTGSVDEHHTPDVTASLDEIPAGALVIVTVKTSSLHEAAMQLGECVASGATLLCIQNGLAPDRLLSEALGRHGRGDLRVLRAITTAGCAMVRPGTIEYWGGGFLFPRSADVAPIAELFRAVGIKTDTSDDLRLDIWRKFAVNCVANPLTAILGKRNCEVISAELADVRRAVADEVARCAMRRGVAFPDDLAAWVDEALASSKNVNSMLQDVRRGRVTEIEALNGLVVRMAEDDGTTAPANATLASIVRFMSTKDAC